MPNTRFIRRTGRRNFRRTFGRRNYSRKNMIKNVVKSMQEIKYTYLDGLGTTFAGGTSSQMGNDVVQLLPVMNQGVGKVSARIGNSVQYKYLTFKMVFDVLWSQNTAQINSRIPSCFYVRVILFQHRIAGITQAANVINIVDNTAATMFRSNVLMLPTLNQNVRVLNDQIFPLMTNIHTNTTTNLAVSNGNAGGMVVTWRHKVNNHVQFKAASESSPSDPRDTYGLLVLMKPAYDTAVGDADVAICRYSYCLKLSYFDL